MVLKFVTLQIRIASVIPAQESRTSGFQCQSLLTRAALCRFMILTKSLHLNDVLVFNTSLCIILCIFLNTKRNSMEKLESMT